MLSALGCKIPHYRGYGAMRKQTAYCSQTVCQKTVSRTAWQRYMVSRSGGIFMFCLIHGKLEVGRSCGRFLIGRTSENIVCSQQTDWGTMVGWIGSRYAIVQSRVRHMVIPSDEMFMVGQTGATIIINDIEGIITFFHASGKHRVGKPAWRYKMYWFGIFGNNTHRWHIFAASKSSGRFQISQTDNRITISW